MTAVGIIQIMLFMGLIAVCAAPLGSFMARVFEGKRTFLHPVLRWMEVWIYKLSGVSEKTEQNWVQYAGSLLSFSLSSFVILYLLQRLQGILPWNPQNYTAATVPPDQAFNVATSFITNTNWQSYVGETTMSYFVQMAGLAVQNFASAAAGIAVATAVIRGFARHDRSTLGNFWVDVTRATVYVLLPLSILAALFYVQQGAVQNLNPYTEAVTVEGGKQIIAQGPVASQEAIKQLGTNGGGFFNANSAHPFENPTPTSNLLAMFLIFLIPGALTYTFGKMVGDTRQGWAIFAAMAVMFLAGVFISYGFEQAGNPNLTKAGLTAAGNMEGKEVRFGIVNSSLFSVITTAASCGAVNAMHDSFMPMGGLVTLFNMMTGEVIFGGVGAGLYGILLYCILAVFIAGLMVGRTPEYLGKKIEQKEVKMAMLAVIATAFSILFFTAVSSVITFPEKGYWNPPGAAIANLNNAGPRGFGEILYAFTSGTANNGSAFAGITVNTPWYHLTIGLAMWIGRFLFLIPLLAAAGNLAAKRRVSVTAGTFPTHGPLFVGLLVGTVVLVGALTFIPALALGPIVEQLLLPSGVLF